MRRSAFVVDDDNRRFWVRSGEPWIRLSDDPGWPRTRAQRVIAVVFVIALMIPLLATFAWFLASIIGVVAGLSVVGSLSVVGALVLVSAGSVLASRAPRDAPEAPGEPASAQDMALVRQLVGGEHTCAVCSYDLESLSGEEDVTCPECGARWMIARWTQYSPGRDSAWGTARARGALWTDGRGEGVALLASASAPDRRAMLRDRLSCARRALAGRAWLALGLSILLVVGSTVFGWYVATPLSGLVVGLGAGAVVMGVVMQDWRKRATARAYGEIIGSAVALGECPQCASELRAEASFSDGCRLCDHCGTAWRSD